MGISTSTPLMDLINLVKDNVSFLQPLFLLLLGVGLGVLLGFAFIPAGIKMIMRYWKRQKI